MHYIRAPFRIIVFLISFIVFTFFFINSDTRAATNSQAESLLIGGFGGGFYLPCLKNGENRQSAAQEYLDGSSSNKYLPKSACIHVSQNFTQGQSITVESSAFDMSFIGSGIELYDTFKSKRFTVGSYTNNQTSVNGYRCDDGFAKCVALADNNKFAEGIKSVVDNGNVGTLGNQCLEYPHKRCCQGENCGAGVALATNPNPGGTCLDSSVCSDVAQLNSSPSPTAGPSPTPLTLPSPIAGLNPTATPTPLPQDQCAGEIGCSCKNLIPGSDGLGIFNENSGGTSLSGLPLIGDVISKFTQRSGAALANTLTGINGVPPDMAPVSNPDDTELMKFYYSAGCKEGAICARTRHIGSYIDFSNPPSINMDSKDFDICVGSDDLAWGSFIRNVEKKYVLGQDIQLYGERTDRKNVAAGGFEPIKVDDLKPKLADMCIKQIPYSSNILEVFYTNNWSDQLLMDIDNEYTDSWDTQANSTWDWWDEVVGKTGNLGTGLFGDIIRSYESSGGGWLVARLVDWGFSGMKATIHAKIAYGEASDYGYLYNLCSKATSYNDFRTGTTMWTVPPSCKDAPSSGKIGKDLIMNLDNDTIHKHGVPTNKVKGLKSALAQCLDCAHEGKISTAIGCIPVTNVQEFIKVAVFGIGLGVAGSFCVLCLIFGAILYQTSQGNSTQIQKAQKLIVNCVVGLIIVIFSLFILKFIGIDILKIPGL